MRVTSTNASTRAMASLQQRQQQMSDAQAQLTSGKRIAKASDDPTGAARAERALAALQRHEANQLALDASRSAMQLGEAALGDAGEMLQQARELLLRAGSGSFGPADRRSLADALGGLRQDLFAVANRGDGAGRYLFGGQGVDRPPLLDLPAQGQPGDPGYLPPRVEFQGSPGELLGDAGEPTLLALDGRRTWLEVPDPADPAATVTVFSVLDQAVATLRDPALSGAQAAAAITTGLAGIDAAAGHLSAWRAQTGVALNRIDGIDARIGQGKIDAEQARAEAEDVDMIEAISSFQNLQSSYDAALKTYSLVQKMSLFDYLR